MSGAVAVHAAYNESGTQGLAVTNKFPGDGMSVFYNSNDTTKQLLYGSAFVEIPSSSGSGNNSLARANVQVFEVNNDIDCLGNLILKVLVSTATGTPSIEPFSAATIIDRIEFQVGTQIWQTLEKVDILALATTELPESAYADFTFQSSGGYSDTLVLNTVAGPTDHNIYYSTTSAGGITAYIPLKILTKTLSPQLENFSEHIESGYLMAAAPNQQVKIKVYTSVRGTGASFPTSGVSPNTSFGDSGFSTATITLSLFAQQHVMCNEERSMLLTNSLPIRIKTTQNVQQYFAPSSPGPLSINLDIFSLYASHLIISIPNNLLTTATFLDDTSTFELLLNSSSFSGALPFGLLSILPSSIGLYNNNYITNEGSQNSYEVFVFPLASRAYGGSSVPLNRFDNISLRIKLSASTSVAGNIYVTCVGETTALFSDGTASLAMY